MNQTPQDESSSHSSSNLFAALDLGSNSFHLLIARKTDGQMQIVDRLRQMVRLSAGIDVDKNLSDEARQRALQCLRQFGERLQELPRENIRVVGTNALRTAKNARGFVRQAEQALGCEIEIISGMEEARLIYRGVADSLATQPQQKRLVVDIGGGSTELIIGEGHAPVCMESLYMGCVSMTKAYFENGEVTELAMTKAQIAARVELRAIVKLFTRVGWDVAIGASGTARAINSVLKQNKMSEEGITAAALQKLVDHLIDKGHYSKFDLKGLSEERAPVFAGGVAVMSGVFKALKIKHMMAADSALREGLLQDLLGRVLHDGDDVRGDSVMHLAIRFHVDLEQARRVAETAKVLLLQVAKPWKLGKTEAFKWIEWAALLHELGLSVAHAQHHKHAQYIIQNADLLGFSRDEQYLLSVLVRLHRRKFASSALKAVPQYKRRFIVKMAIILRLAVIMHRKRDDASVPQMTLKTNKKRVELLFEQGWLQSHKLTRAGLDQEVILLAEAGYELSVE